MTGLALAHQLAQGGLQVTVLDAQSAGGLSLSQRFHDFVWDRFYHVILPSDRELLQLLEELGLGGELVWRRTQQGCWIGDRLCPLNTALDLLRLPTLPLSAKLRIGWMALRAPRAFEDDRLDSQTSAEWLRAWCGEPGYRDFWRHLLRAKLGSAAEWVSARFIFATIRRLASARKAGGSGDTFGYVRGGYRTILGRMLERLAALGVRVVEGSKVESVRLVRDGVEVDTPAGTFPADTVFLTMHNPMVAELLPMLPDAERLRLQDTAYLGVACTVAVGRRPLSANYILNVVDDRSCLTGVIETTNVVDASAETNGHALVYLPRYAPTGDPIHRQDDAAIAEAALRDLRRIRPAAGGDWLLHQSVQRARFIQPIPRVGAAPVRPPREVVPGKVYVVNNAQLSACILNNSDCVGLARRAAERFLARQLGGPQTRREVLAR